MGEVLVQALQLHQSGRPAEAERLYRSILIQDPKNLDAHHLLGLLLHQMNRPEQAVESLRRAVELNPNLAETHNNLGIVYRMQGKYADAENLFRRCLTIRPDYLEARQNLGRVLRLTGRLDEAEACFQQVVREQPMAVDAWIGLGITLRERRKTTDAERAFAEAVRLRGDSHAARYNHGFALADLGRRAEALAEFEEAHRLQPSDPESLTHIGVMLAELGRAAEAEPKYREAIRLRPEYPEANTNLAALLLDQKKPEEALPFAETAVRLRPGHAGMFINLGGVFRGLARHREALEQYREAVRLAPTSFEALHGLGSCQLELNEPDQALVSFEGALEKKPDHADSLIGQAGALRALARLDEAVAINRRAVQLRPDALTWNALGTCLLDLGRWDEAEAALESALKCEPNNAIAHFYHAVHRLLHGRYKEGWAEYQWRWGVPGHSRAILPKPEWTGAALDDKTILLIAEQGHGDIFQFVRYTKLVKERGGTVILSGPPYLRELLVGCPGVDMFVGTDDKLPEFDVYAHLLTLPKILDTTVQTVPATIPYLTADPRRQEAWRPRIERLSGLKVGVIWQGNPNYRNDWKRSVPAAKFAALAKIPGVSIVKLQKGTASKDPNAAGLIDLGSQYDTGNWLDTAALVSLLDLVISVDTGPVHLAGALGVPVWLALPVGPDFRWLLGRDDSPWYPSFRLFRQPKPG
ncbi:MAG TPA: tetratricopeptide repeat protein, partial [Gemmataceae bacterium]|nr:tetratricopeptide repeat protein [Gemmataceae bacterium]